MLTEIHPLAARLDSSDLTTQQILPYLLQYPVLVGETQVHRDMDTLFSSSQRHRIAWHHDLLSNAYDRFLYIKPGSIAENAPPIVLARPRDVYEAMKKVLPQHSWADEQLLKELRELQNDQGLQGIIDQIGRRKQWIEETVEELGETAYRHHYRDGPILFSNRNLLHYVPQKPPKEDTISVFGPYINL